MSKHKYISFKEVIARENAHVVAPASFRNFSISQEKPELLVLYTNMSLNKEVYDNLWRPKTSGSDGGIKKLLPMIMMCFRKIKECAECLINLVKCQQLSNTGKTTKKENVVTKSANEANNRRINTNFPRHSVANGLWWFCVLKVLDRGEKIELLVDKTENLQFQANSFQIQGRQLRRKMWLQNLQTKLIIGGSILTFLPFISKQGQICHCEVDTFASMKAEGVTVEVLEVIIHLEMKVMMICLKIGLVLHII
nr:vesicle-associated membrane protein 727 [Tanacetum cinerariifolium]